MKKQTKIKVTAIAACFAFATMVGTFILCMLQHPAEWYMAGICAIAMAIMIFVGVTIEN